MAEDSSTRWVRAESAAQGLRDEGVGRAVRRYYAIAIPLALFLGVVVMMIVFNLFNEPMEMTSVVSGALLITGFVVMGYGLIYARKKVSPLITPKRASVISILGKEDAQRVRKQVYGAALRDPAQLVVSRGAAIQLLKGMAQQLLVIPGQLMIFAAGLFIDSGFRPLWVVFSVIWAGLLVVMIRQFWKILRFLKETDPAVAID